MEGVLGPFLPLGRALIEQGDELIIATGPDLPTRAGTNGMRFAPAGLSAMEGAVAAMGDAEVQAAPPGDRVRFPAAMFGAVIPAAKLPALRTLATSWRPDLIVHPPVDLAGPSRQNGVCLCQPAGCQQQATHRDERVAAPVREPWKSGYDRRSSAAVDHIARSGSKERARCTLTPAALYPRKRFGMASGIRIDGIARTEDQDRAVLLEVEREAPG